MQNTFKSFFEKIMSKKILLCLLIIGIFIVYMLFFDSYNLIDRAKNTQKIKQLEKEIEYYNTLIEKDQQRIHELQSSDKNLEKFAREQFLMKKDNEDIFIIEEE